MYDQSLEQLIDAVIADGVITDQERKVVFKKAASLGIDQDEIEVYLEGKLSQLNSKGANKSSKYGAVRTCPNCGANIGSFAAKCPECGHEITDINANSSVKSLQKQLDEIDKESRNSAIGSMLSSTFGIGKAVDRKIQLIENFAIPNTKEDLIEFAMLCESHLSGMTAGADQKVQLAWKKKAKQIIAKANLLFPSDKDVEVVIAKLKKTNSFFHSQTFKALTGALVCFLCLFLLFKVVFYYSSNVEDEANAYMEQKIEQINNLPTPTVDNYTECYRKLNAIIWTESTSSEWREPYKNFKTAQDSYRDLLLSAYKEAGVPDENIPKNLFKSQTDTENEGDSLESDASSHNKTNAESANKNGNLEAVEDDDVSNSSWEISPEEANAEAVTVYEADDIE